MSSREVYEIAITRPAGVSVGDMQRYLKSQIEYFCNERYEGSKFKTDDAVRVLRQTPGRKFWIKPDAQLPSAGKHVHVKFTNNLTAKAYLEVSNDDPVKWCEWVNVKTGRKIPWTTVQEWMY